MKTPLKSPLVFEDVAFGYEAGREPVLRGLTAEVPPRSVTAVLGANGAGKTTLLLLALGWLAPKSGRVLLDGRPLCGYPRREMGRISALVPQSERMPFNYSVLDYAMMGRAPHMAALAVPGAADAEAARRAVDRAGLGGLAQRAVTSLSAGERQLTLIARALAQEPALLLLDEPTSHLDLANKARILALIRDLTADGVTVLLTTHEPEVASSAANLILMREGKAGHSGPTRDVFTAENLSETYGIPVRVAEVEGRRVASWSPPA